jgi:aminoglycoside phosphotransferase (APT) family kinase protein
MSKPAASPEQVGPLLAGALQDQRWEQCLVERVSGGRSNLTFLVTSDAGRVVLRRPPTGALLPRAHDMHRERRFLTALASTDVPVPMVLAHGDADSPLGAPFYVMPFIDGDIIRSSLPRTIAGIASELDSITAGLLTTLTALHALTPGDLGLAGLERPGNFFERQLRRWTLQATACRADSRPPVAELISRLQRCVPSARRSAVVHGDYRLDNVIFAPHEAGSVRAVLDWELATVGDPLSDLALLLVYWPQHGDPDERGSCLPIDTVTSLPGFPGRTAIAERYAVLSGQALDDIAWVQALAFLKLSVITTDIGRRAAQDDPAAPGVGQADALAQYGTQALQEKEIV